VRARRQGRTSRARSRPCASIDAALGAFGLADLEPVPLLLPRPVLYDTWNVLGVPPLGLLHPALRDVDIVHAPSLAIPPRSGVPLIVTAHDAATLVHPETYPAGAAGSITAGSRLWRAGPIS
jgi:hypothetical protein